MTKIRYINSSVAADKSIGLIEKKLVENGATDNPKSYDPQGTLYSMQFRRLANGRFISYELPANIMGVYHYLNSQRKGRVTELQKKSDMEQAQRTAWKLIYEWVDMQMTMVNLQQMEFEQIFLPQMIVAGENGTGKTTYQAMKDGNFLALK